MVDWLQIVAGVSASFGFFHLYKSTKVSSTQKAQDRERARIWKYHDKVQADMRKRRDCDAISNKEYDARVKAMHDYEAQMKAEHSEELKSL